MNIPTIYFPENKIHSSSLIILLNQPFSLSVTFEAMVRSAISTYETLLKIYRGCCSRVEREKINEKTKVVRLLKKPIEDIFPSNFLACSS